MKLKKELIKLGSLPATLNKGIFILAKEHKAIGIITCFVSDVLWGANKEFSYIIKQLKSTFKIVAEHKEMFEYIRVHLQQNTECSIILDQNRYIITINLIPINLEQLKQRHRPLSKQKTTLLRGELAKLNWVIQMTRPGIIFHVCGTKNKIAIISDIISVNKVIKFFKNTPSHIKIPSFDLGSLEINLYSPSWHRDFVTTCT